MPDQQTIIKSAVLMKVFAFPLALAVVLLCSTPLHAIDFAEVPQSHHAHPELQMAVREKSYDRALYELVHLRTDHSRTILNDNQTRTTIKSSVPIHYQDDNGYWRSLTHELAEQDDHFVFPSNAPSFLVDRRSGDIELLGPAGQIMRQSGALRLIAGARSGGADKVIESGRQQIRMADERLLVYEGGFDGVDIERRFSHGALLNHYVLHAQEILFAPFEGLALEQELELPAGFVLEGEPNGEEASNRLVVRDDRGQVAFTIEAPLVTDQAPVELKTRHLHKPYHAGLSFQRVAESTYTIAIELSAVWLLSPDRQYPVSVRSLIVIENDDLVNSCYSPNFQQSTLTVNVPEGETVLWTDIEYDFTAAGDGWRADQRSFVSGPAGQTSVFSGLGNSPGVQTYTVDLSEIGNVTSDGEVTYTFHSSRTWGGAGCNATFNYLSRRKVSVTYGTTAFGDGPVTVNEYSASNRSFQDSFGRTEDWIELHNTDPDFFFDLTGYHLSNDADNPTQWQITSGTIPPGGHLIVFASGRDISSGMVQHANFKLTQLRPDQIVFSDPDGNILELHDMHVTQVNHSYGRVHDGADEWGVFASPSPGNSNADAFVTYASRPEFSIEAGSYQGSVTLEMSAAGSDEQIRFTTDGSTPTPSSSLYTTPVVLDQTTVVRARTFSNENAFLPSLIETGTYLINEDITLPVFSFAGDQDMLNLFGGDASLRPLGHFEYFESDGRFIDGNFGDFNKHGNDSWNYPQRGVDFISRDDYGYQRRLEYKFFETSDRTRFRRLMVKAAANDNYPFESGGAHIRDSYIQHLSQVAGLDLDERSSTNVLVFVNGQYWGVYDLRERVDDNNFTNFYYGQDYKYRESDVYLQFLKTWQGTSAHFGNQPAISDWSSLRQYVLNNNMGDPFSFEYVRSQLNIGSLIDYFVINSWVVSRDWLNYNTGWWRGLDPSASARQWRYILWDMEAAFGHFINYTGLPNASHTAPPCQAENLTVGDGHTDILRKLIEENPEVRRQYVTRYVDLLNTHLSADNAIALLDSMIDDIAPEMPRHIARWGGNLGTWQSNVQAIRDFINDRHDYLMNSGMASCYDLSGPFATEFNVVPESGGTIRMNSESLSSYPFSAQVFGNIETRLQAQPDWGYTFSHWEVDGAVVPPTLTDPTLALAITQATSVTAHFNPPATDGELLYYWHFNDLETPEDVVTIDADYSLIPFSTGSMTYTGAGPRDIDANDTGSDLNLHLGEPPGKSARVRNPSEGRSLIFDVPTTGYEQINFTYAVERTNNGMLSNVLSYSIDGTNFIQEGLPIVTFDLEEAQVYYPINLDFAGIEGVANNPDFRIRIDFEGNTTGDSGNNRFDNITLKGMAIEGDDPAQLVFVTVNDNEPVFAGESFFVAIQSQDEDGAPAIVDLDTEVSLAVLSGQGELSGTVSGTIPAGDHSVIIEQVVYSQPDQAVSLAATADTLTDGASETFNVLQRTYALSLGKNVQGAGTVSGAGQFAEGEQVVINAIIEPGFAFHSWVDEAGQLVYDQPEVGFSMPAESLAYTAVFTLPAPDMLIHYWHFNDLDDGDLDTVVADFSMVGTASITYPGLAPETPAGVMDRRSHNNSNPVSNFNLRLDQMPDAGNVLRVRNPSDENKLRIAVPTTGYRDIVVSFATTRTNNGAQEQSFHFSIDQGETWVALGETYLIAALDDDGYLAKTFNLSSYEAVNDNPDLLLKILFTGEAAGNTSGNNRFDNITVEGVSMADMGDPVFSDRFQEPPDG